MFDLILGLIFLYIIASVFVNVLFRGDGCMKWLFLGWLFDSRRYRRPPRPPMGGGPRPPRPRPPRPPMGGGFGGGSSRGGGFGGGFGGGGFGGGSSRGGGGGRSF